MSGGKSLEDQVKLLQKQFGGLVKLVKEIKTSVETLEKKEVPKEIDEVKDILEAQKVIDKILAENAESIKRIDHEMDEWKKNNDKRKAPMDTIDKETNVSVVKAGKKEMQVL